MNPKRTKRLESGRRQHRNFRLHPELADKLKHAATRSRMTQTAIVEVALEAHLGGVK